MFTLQKINKGSLYEEFIEIKKKKIHGGIGQRVWTDNSQESQPMANKGKTHATSAVMEKE